MAALAVAALGVIPRGWRGAASAAVVLKLSREFDSKLASVFVKFH